MHIKKLYGLYKLICRFDTPQSYLETIVDYITEFFSSEFYVSSFIDLSTGKHSPIIYRGYVQQNLDDLNEKWRQYDYLTVNAVRNNLPMFGADFLTSDEVYGSQPYFNEFLRPIGVRYGNGLPLYLFNQAAGITHISRHFDNTEFTKTECDYLRHLVPWLNFAFENYFILKKYHQNEDSDNYPFHAYYDKESLHIDTDDGVSIINQINSTHISSKTAYKVWFINWIEQITKTKYLLSQNLCTIDNKLFQFNFLREENGDCHIFYGEPLNMYLSVILGYEAMTSREYEIFNHIVDGKKNSDIADILNISQNTVSFHLKNIFKKYDVHTRLELLAKLNISG